MMDPRRTDETGHGDVKVDNEERGPAVRWGSRRITALVVLWLTAGALAVRQAVTVLGESSDQRLTELSLWLARGGPLSDPETVYRDQSFAGTPLGAALFKPFSTLDPEPLAVVWTLGLLVLFAALAVLVVRALPGTITSERTLLLLPLLAGVLLVSEPVRDAFDSGAPGVVPVLLALLGFVYGTNPVWRSASPVVPVGGLLIGLAAALQPALLLFAPVLWLVGRRREAVVTTGGFLAGTLVAWAALPAASNDYWLHHFMGTGLGGAADEAANQSLHGLLLRLGLSGPLEIALFLVLAAVVAVGGLRRAARFARDGQLLLAAALVGCVVLAVSPAAWQHQQLWILLAAVGRVGRRRGDRLVWPVLVVLVMSLSSEALVPKIAWLEPLGENAPLLVALAAAVALPFVSRSSPVWDRPEPSSPFSRPHLMLELLLIRVGYFAYSYVRSLAPDGRELAESHGHQILTMEKALHLDMEKWLNEVVARTSWLQESMNFYYGAFHFLVPVSLLAWLYLRQPATYRWARGALCFATLLGLVGFLLYPLAPPRLMPDLGFVDTINGPQDFDDPSFGVLTGVSNQYAAMPSLHVGWSLWAALVLIRITPHLWVRLLGALYPVLTTVVVMGTANHYLLDAAGGAVVVAAGFALAGLWNTHGPARHAREGAPAEETPAEADVPVRPAAKLVRTPGQTVAPSTPRQRGSLSAPGGGPSSAARRRKEDADTTVSEEAEGGQASPVDGQSVAAAGNVRRTGTGPRG